MALITPLGRADAAVSMLCTGYSACASGGYSDGGYAKKQGTSYWAMYTGTNCTNYVAYRLVTTNGMPNLRPAAGVGNARDWGTTMASITNSTPTVGSVAWWGSGVGGNHVAYVEKVVSSTEIWVSESNWSGAFDWRKITKTGSGWPQGFIHFADKATTPTTPTPAPAKPMTISQAPEMSGIPTVGVPLSVGSGTWSPASSATTYSYQWMLDRRAVSGGTSSTFTPTEAMLGRSLSVKVTAKRSGYTTTSTTVHGVDVWPVTLRQQQAPTISGSPQVGQRLSVSSGVWFPQPDEHAYRWLANGVVITGATGASFTPTAAHRGQKVTAEVTARHPDYDQVVARTVPTAAVAP